MPQELHILKCFSCEAFQVDIVKKIPKWCCKICGEKQSVKKIYGKGTGKECRLLVQKLNEERLTKNTPQLPTGYDGEDDANFLKSLGAVPGLSVPNFVKKSKWEEFMENTVNAEEENTINAEAGNSTVNLEEENEDNSEKVANIFDDDEDADFEANKKRKLAELLENSINPKSGRQIGNISEKTGPDLKVNKKSKWTNFIANDTESIAGDKKAENASRRKDNIFEDDADLDSILVV